MNSRVIRLKPWEENDTEHIAIDFRFNAEIIEILEEAGATLSPTSGYWLMPATVGNVSLLYHKLRYLGEVFNCGVKPFNKDRATNNLDKPKALSFNEICQTLKACRNIKQRCLLTLMYSSGLRVGEAVCLKLNDLNFNRGTLRITAARGRAWREAVLPETSVPIIETYLSSYDPKEWLFEGSVNGHNSILGAKIILRQALIRAGINKQVNGQTLRHSLTAHLLLQGVDARTVDKVLNGPLVTGGMVATPLSKTV